MTVLREDLAIEVLRALIDVERSDEFLSYLGDDATWTIPGDWRHISGVHDRAGIEVFIRKVFPAGFPTGLTAEVHRAHSTESTTGSTAVVELTARGVTSKGRDYQNGYCFVLDFTGDKVSAIREYMDTLYADRVLHR